MKNDTPSLIEFINNYLDTVDDFSKQKNSKNYSTDLLVLDLSELYIYKPGLYNNGSILKLLGLEEYLDNDIVNSVILRELITTIFSRYQYDEFENDIYTKSDIKFLLELLETDYNVLTNNDVDYDDIYDELNVYLYKLGEFITNRLEPYTKGYINISDLKDIPMESIFKTKQFYVLNEVISEFSGDKTSLRMMVRIFKKHTKRF